jgi:hypothetical protein
MDHPLAKLARSVDLGFLEARFGAVYSDKLEHVKRRGPQRRSA